MEQRIMHSIDEVVAKVAESEGKVASLITLVQTLHQQVIDALANTAISPEVQAKLDGIFSTEDAEAVAVQAAIDANQPPV
jgi:lipoate-protein ligase B